MFVKSNMNELVTYRKSSFNVNIKPNTVTYVDEAVITAAELKACYGDRITIISPELNEVMSYFPSEQLEKEAAKAPVEVATSAPESDEEEIKDLLNDNPEVKEFLEGETDKLPEGTGEISIEEAERLKREKEEAEKEAREREEKYKAELAKAEAYFEDIKQDDDSDKHLKLAIEEKLKEEASKEGRTWEIVSLMEEIEKLFPEEKAKLEKEVEKLNAQSQKNSTKQKAKSAKSNKTNSKTKNK